MKALAWIKTQLHVFAKYLVDRTLPPESLQISYPPKDQAPNEVSETLPLHQMRGCRELLIVYADALSIRAQIEVIERSLATDPGLVFTHCRGLLETVCRTILADRGTVIEGADPKPKWLMTETLKALKLTPSEFDSDKKVENGVSEILRSMNALVNGVVDLRNSQGVGPHGKDALEAVLDIEYAQICAVAVDAAASLLLRLHRKQAATDPLKRLRFGDHPEFDSRLDREYPDLKVEDVPLIASKSLYHSDPDGYRQKLVEFLNAPAEDAEEFAEGEITGDQGDE